ncbi:MAG: InlB B-repeat-containing protein [Alkalispirochaeta sp.]
MKTNRIICTSVIVAALIATLAGCFGPLNTSQQSLQIELRPPAGQVSARSLTDGEDGYLFAMVVSEEVLLDGGESATALLQDTETALVDAQEAIAGGTTPAEFQLNLDLEAAEFQSLIVNLGESPSGTARFSDLATGVPYYVVVHLIGTRETLIGTGRATLVAGETTTVPIELSDDLAAFETEVSTRYGGTIDLSLEYTVTFDTRGGSTIEPVTLARGTNLGDALAQISGEPTRSPDTFLGWMLDGVGGSDVTNDTDSAVLQDVTLAASWTATIEVSNLLSTLESLPNVFFGGNAYYDLVDAETYMNPDPVFGEIIPPNFNLSPGAVDTWYNQDAVALIDESHTSITKTGQRKPLEDPDEDGIHTITGIAPGKSWRVLITTWDSREDVPAGEGALFSSTHESEDGQTIEFAAENLESASWDS